MHYVASDLGLHCLPMTLLQVSRQKWVKRVLTFNLLLTSELVHLIILTSPFLVLAFLVDVSIFIVYHIQIPVSKQCRL